MTSEKLTIGTSGFTYNSKRKGESLYGRLALDSTFSDCEFVASGRGWPVRTRGYSWDDMQKFYQSLDVYVCTSMIEGIGYGVLEAMACGIPVVIPIDVGIFDELPDLENLHRYKAGDYNDLKRALLEAIDKVKINAVNVPSLRSATLKYSADAWVNDHKTVFENFLYGVQDLPPENKSWHNKACIFYVAYGKPALDCVKRAIVSAKKYLPEIPVVLVSDKSGYGEDIYIYHTDDDIGARSVKTSIFDLAPKEFEYVMYLDADTEIISSDMSNLFDILQDGWEVIFAFNPAQYVLVREMMRPDNQDEISHLVDFLGTDEMLQLNGGMFVYRVNERTKKFFDTWQSEYVRYFKRDQASLDRAYYKYPVKMYVVGEEWNTITRYTSAERSAALLHYPLSARRFRGRISGKLNSIEAWASVYPTKEDFEQWKKENEK